MKRTLQVILCSLLATISLAQPGRTVTNLVFEGAGIRGIAYCGAIQELESRGLMNNVHKVGGTSAGAIMALGIALGYTGSEMQSIISSTKFKKFNDGKYFFVGGIVRTNKYYGWYQGKKFEKWLEKFISDKTGNAEINFEEFYSQGHRELFITGTNLNKQELVIFSRHNYPKMRVKDAVRISMSIPFYFEAMFIDKEGRVYHRPKKLEGLEVMVDGGMIGNFPITMFDSAGVVNEGTLGFRIDSDAQIEFDRSGKHLAPMPVNNFRQYVSAFYNMLLENLNRQPLTKADWNRTVSISDGNIPPKIRKLSSQEISRLIENGRLATAEWLNK